MLHRPHFIGFVLFLLLVGLVGCSPGPTAPPTIVDAPEGAQPPVSAVPSQYSEAPMLAAQVERGELPPVEERLPVDPMIVEPIEEIGVYGGTWLLLAEGQPRITDVAEFTDVGLLMWSLDQTEPMPGIAAGWEVSEDGREVTVTLREGLKWSDGHPFTTEDILFWYEDIAMHSELMPVRPAFLRTASGSYGIIEVVDDITFKVVFEEPHGLFITLLTKEVLTFAPKHYLSQFHTGYATEAELQQHISEAGVNTWLDLFWLKAAFGTGGTQGMANPDLPSMFPWIPTIEPPAERFIFVRNPYFWAVDTAGNQLPYIDQVDMRIVDPEVMNLRITAGEPNFQVSRPQSFQNMALYIQYAEENDYRILQWGDLQVSEAGIWVNQNTPDPVDREIYQDVRFRIALSLGINRDRINQTLYLGMGRPTQATIGVAKYMREEYLSAYTEYDPERANQLLDEIGLTERDSEGFRLKPDGTRLAPVIEVPSPRLGMIDNLTIIKEDYTALGIDLIVRPIDQTLWTTRRDNGEMQFSGWPVAKPETDTGLVPGAPSRDWAPLWGLWYLTNGQQGEEPPQHIKDLQGLWTEILVTTDPEQQDALFHQILQAQADNLWVIGVVGPVPKPIIVKTWFRNIKDYCIWSFHHGHFIGCTAVYQAFIEREHQ
jgi:peptide/nickel transport system substrate-binding protein